MNLIFQRWRTPLLITLLGLGLMSLCVITNIITYNFSYNLGRRSGNGIETFWQPIHVPLDSQLIIRGKVIDIVTRDNLPGTPATTMPPPVNESCLHNHSAEKLTEHARNIGSKENKTLVLLVTYARSGSTWLGQITNQIRNSFYIYEPFQYIIKEGYYKTNQVCFNNNTCRRPRTNSETHTFALQQISNLLNCRFDLADRKVQMNLFRHDRVGIQRSEEFVNCLAKAKAIKLSVYMCYDYLLDACRRSDYRIIKTIRLSMDIVRMLITQAFHLNLKIILLVRDPRAITNSRLREGSFRMTRKIKQHSRDMCMRMSNDVQILSDLRRTFPNRLTLVVYENLADKSQKGARFVYDFIDTTVTKSMEDWVYTSSHGQTNNGYYKTVRNASLASYHWRSQLKFHIVKIIDNQCIGTYQRLGYLPIQNVYDLNDTSKSLRNSSVGLNGVVWN